MATLGMILMVGAGGFVGTVLRYSSGLLLHSVFPAPALNTFFVNVVGSFVIGWVYGHGTDKYGLETMSVITIGVLGGFTTFSAFSADTLFLLKDGSLMLAIGYVVLVVVTCLLATYLGNQLALA